MDYYFYDIVNRIDNLYVSFRRRFIIAANQKIYIPKDKKTKEDLYLDKRYFIGHLNHRYAIGVFGGEKTSKFVCFDVDMGDNAVVKKVIDGIEAFGFPRDRIYVSSSGGKGYHVEIFFDNIVYTNLLREFYEYVINAAGLDPHKVEFRPTSKQSIKLPLSVHPRTGNVCWYVDRETLEPIEDMGYILSIQPVDSLWAKDLIHEKAKVMPGKEREFAVEEQKVAAKSIDILHFEDELPQMTAPGMMHNLMLSIGVHERYAGKPQEEIEKILLEWAARQPEDYVTNTRQKIEEDAAQIAAWVWRPSFAATQRRNKGEGTLLTKAEMEMIMAQRGGTRRKALFLIMMFCKWKSVAPISLCQIARYIKASIPCTVKMVRSLEEEGVIWRVDKNRHRKRDDGTYYMLPDVYAYKQPEYSGGETCEIKWSYRADDFINAWRTAVEFFIPKEEWDKVFYKRELEELRNG